MPRRYDLLTPSQAAKIIGVSSRRVYQYCEADRLGFVLGGGDIRKRYLIPRKEAVDFEAMPAGRPPAIV